MTDRSTFALVTEQIDFWWSEMFVPRMRGLTDAEYFWEPVEGCWSVRKQPDGRFRPEGTWPEPYPPPVTTIAWRLCHLTPYERASRHFGDGSLTSATVDFPANAADAIAFAERGWKAWRDGIESLGEDGIWTRKIGPTEPPQYAEMPFVTLIIHINRELIHHSAEIAVLRDLYAANARSTPFVQACLRGDVDEVERLRRADPDVVARTIAALPDLVSLAAGTGVLPAVRLLVDLGFDPSAMNRQSALHQAVQAGDLEVVRYLVERGADTSAKDAVFHETPAGWARYFSKTAIADYLSG